MTNNDDFDQQDFNPIEDMGQSQKAGMRANLSEAWKTRPLFKLMVLMIAVAAVVAAGVSFFGSGTTSTSTARLPSPPNINGAPGGDASPYQQQQTDLANRDRASQAFQNGGSAIATPIGNTTDISALTNPNKQNDPLTELRAEVERLRQDQKQVQQQQVQQQQVLQQQPARVQQQETFDDTLATAMQHQMSQLNEAWTPQGVKQVTVTKNEDLKNTSPNAASGAPGGKGATASASSTPAAPAKVLLTAGTVSYAQLLTEANSDVPGPILAQIVSGPFSGARAVGQFQVANGYADYLVLQFNLVSLKGKDYSISAIALDPNTTLGGMATEVDQRYLTRVVLPAAAGFLSGFGQALGTGNSSTTTNGTSTIIQQSRQGYRQGLFQGLGQAAQTMSQFLQNQANQTKPLVRVAAGTPMGLFFTQSVTDTTVQQQQLQQQQSPFNTANGFGAPNGYGGGNGFGTANPYGTLNGFGGNTSNPYAAGTYPGTNVTGYGNASQNLPYPNYANPANTSGASYSVFPGQGQGFNNTFYTR